MTSEPGRVIRHEFLQDLILQRKLHTSLPKTKNLKQLCSFLKTYVFNK